VSKITFNLPVYIYRKNEKPTDIIINMVIPKPHKVQCHVIY